MRSFFLFLIRNYAILLFLFLELLSFWLVFSNNIYHNAYFVNSANVVTGNVLNTYGNLTNYFYLKSINDSLIAENAKLRSEIKNAWQIDTVKTYSEKDSLGVLLYTYIPAEVINNSFTDPNNYITINRGSNHGIKKDMGVITYSGIVGIVKSVSPNFSVVLSVLNRDFHTRAAVKRNNAQGRLEWQPGNPAVVKMVDVSEPGILYEGDTVITTSFSSVFPPNTIIGTVKRFNKLEGSNFYTIDITLANNFGSLKYVYVVNYLRKEEKTNLEQQTINGSN